MDELKVQKAAKEEEKLEEKRKTECEEAMTLGVKKKKG